MQRLEVSGAVRSIYGSLGVKRLITKVNILRFTVSKTSTKKKKVSALHVTPLYQHLRRKYFLSCPDDVGSATFRNIGKFLPGHKFMHPRRHLFSHF